jgi:2,4-dienoyl-CoA reductase (NADPH2)
MQAALTCAERGHKVTLAEREPYLGGKWTLAAFPPGRGELIHFLIWLLGQVKKVGVDIRTGVEHVRDFAKELAPDAIIVCTGSEMQVPKIPGVDLPHVVRNDDVLGGNAEVGERVVVVGGGGVGVETAIYLARRGSLSPDVVKFLLDYEAVDREYALSSLSRGHQVTIVEQMDKVAEGVGPSNKWVLRKELSMSNVQVLTKAGVQEINERGVVVDTGGAQQLVEADTVVLATGFAPDTSFYETMKDLAPEVYVAGNAFVEGHTIDGLSHAFEVAMRI